MPPAAAGGELAGCANGAGQRGLGGRATSFPRAGLTLIELLVVIIIMSTLVATVIPMMASSVEKRRVREAARMVSAYLSAARARAIKTGRPVGVMIQRMANEPGAAMVLNIAKQPLPFAGSMPNSIAHVWITGTGQRDPRNSADPTLYDTFKASFETGFRSDIVRVGDRVRFNDQGLFYEITAPGNTIGRRVASGSNVLSLRIPSRGSAYPWPSRKRAPNAFPVSYRIFRQPVRSAAAPLQLPDGVVIDLFGSGLGSDLFHNPAAGNDNQDPITITFTPEGGFDFLRHNEGTDRSPKSKIERGRTVVYLLVGKVENVGETNVPPDVADLDDSDVPKPNWLDPDSLWISISPQTGQVGTAENSATAAYNESVSGANRIQTIRDARRFAREMRSTGGR